MNVEFSCSQLNDTTFLQVVWRVSWKQFLILWCNLICYPCCCIYHINGRIYLSMLYYVTFLAGYRTHSVIPCSFLHIKNELKETFSLTPSRNVHFSDVWNAVENTAKQTKNKSPSFSWEQLVKNPSLQPPKSQHPAEI